MFFSLCDCILAAKRPFKAEKFPKLRDYTLPIQKELRIHIEYTDIYIFNTIQAKNKSNPIQFFL